MNRTTLAALKKGIRKYEKLSFLNSPEKILHTDIKSTGCALCQLFVDNAGTCMDCPVAIATGFPLCVNTPWTDILSIQNQMRSGCAERINAFLWRKACKREAEFLKSLLPE